MLSYTTNGSGVDLGKLGKRLLRAHNPTPQCGASDQKPWTDGQVSNSSSNYPPKDNRSRGMTITFLHRVRVFLLVSLFSGGRTRGGRSIVFHLDVHPSTY